MAKSKYYVVWSGKKTGVFSTWDECQRQIAGVPDAKYKSFESKAEAEFAYSQKPEKFIYKKDKAANPTNNSTTKPILDSIAVDGAWNTATLDCEYQGVFTKTGKVLFKMGPYKHGTNNVVEYLALVHALGYCQKHNLSLPIYSDSKTAISWVKNKKIKTTLEQTEKNQELFDMLERAENWLKTNRFGNQILKWETEDWGENPADFGRK